MDVICINDESLVLPSETEGIREAIEEMQNRLDKFDNENVIKASVSCDNNEFLIWSLNVRDGLHS